MLIKNTINRKDIPEETRKKALAEIDEIVADGGIDFKDSEDLGMAFCWSETSSDHNFWNEIDEAPDLPATETVAGAMRMFNTGATRSCDQDKLDYEGFLSPIVLRRYAEYLHKHRIQADGKLRDSDNWQKGIPIKEYMKSKWRHFMTTWLWFRLGLCGPRPDIEDSLCAEIFNTMGFLHEILKDKMEQIVYDE